jgi:hypothetical protein
MSSITPTTICGSFPTLYTLLPTAFCPGNNRSASERVRMTEGTCTASGWPESKSTYSVGWKSRPAIS